MSIRLSVTSAGRVALANNAMLQVGSIEIEEMRIGSGLNASQVDDDQRTGLRIEKATSPVVGGTANQGERIGVRGDFTPAENFAVTEMGLFADLEDGTRILFMYWAASSADEAIATAKSGAKLTIGAIIVMTNSNATITVDTSPTVQIGGVGVPIGSIIDFGGTVAPSGWLLCDGASYSRADHPLLYGVIGLSWGAGDGADTFQVPDLRRRVSVGAGGTAGNGLDADVGSVGGNEKVAVPLLEHTHTASTGDAGSHTHTVKFSTIGVHGQSPNRYPLNRSGTSQDVDTESAGSHTHTVSIDKTGTANAQLALIQPSAVVTKIIRAE